MPVVFRGFSFDGATGELARDGSPIRLQAQPARVLRHLIEHRGRTVLRDELVHHVWPDTNVNFNQSLNYCIRRIRLALGDDIRNPTFILTVPRKGYQWIAPVEDVAATAGARKWPRLALREWGALAATALFSASITVVLMTPGGTGHGQPAVPSARSHLHLAIDALHSLSHALIESGRRAEAPRAVRTLWVVTTSHFGLSAESDLR